MQDVGRGVGGSAGTWVVAGPALGDIVYFSFGKPGEVICDIALAISLEDQATPFFLSEMGTMYDNGVDWENPNFRFYVHYDSNDSFDAYGLTLAEALP